MGLAVVCLAAMLLDFSPPFQENDWRILKAELERTEIAALP
jgi:hypothetical protein